MHPIVAARLCVASAHKLAPNPPPPPPGGGAVLDVMEREELQAHARRVGSQFVMKHAQLALESCITHEAPALRVGSQLDARERRMRGQGRRTTATLWRG